MTEQWQELKETIIELRDNDGTGTQQEVCKFLANYMDILERQMQEPSDDAINREDALMCLTGEIKGTDTIETIIARFVRRIRKLPPVTPQPKIGHWIGVDQEPHEDWECDNCGHIEYANEDVPDEYHFCPNCGAKMVEPQESEG